LNFSAEVAEDHVTWNPYPEVLRVTARSNGHYKSQPDWYRNFAYSEEQARGLDFIEDLASPGVSNLTLEHDRAARFAAGQGPRAKHRSQCARRREEAVPVQNARPARRDRSSHWCRQNPGRELFRLHRVDALARNLLEQTSAHRKETPRGDRLGARRVLLEGFCAILAPARAHYVAQRKSTAAAVAACDRAAATQQQP
jgi:glycogen debranching enzyme